MYIGAYFTTGKGNSLVSYRRDGSLLYANETKAYNRIWNQASVHYRKMGGLPVLVIGKDEVTRGFYYDFNEGKILNSATALDYNN